MLSLVKPTQILRAYKPPQVTRSGRSRKERQDIHYHEYQHSDHLEVLATGARDAGQNLTTLLKTMLEGDGIIYVAAATLGVVSTAKAYVLKGTWTYTDLFVALSKPATGWGELAIGWFQEQGNALSQSVRENPVLQAERNGWARLGAMLGFGTQPCPPPTPPPEEQEYKRVRGARMAEIQGELRNTEAKYLQAKNMIDTAPRQRADALAALNSGSMTKEQYAQWSKTFESSFALAQSHYADLHPKRQELQKEWDKLDLEMQQYPMLKKAYDDKLEAWKRGLIMACDVIIAATTAILSIRFWLEVKDISKGAISMITDVRKSVGLPVP